MDDDLIPKARSKYPYSGETEMNSSSSKMFDDRELKFPIAGTDDRFLNVCLWCEPRLDFDVPTLDKKHVLLGYVSIDRWRRRRRRRTFSAFLGFGFSSTNCLRCSDEFQSRNERSIVFSFDLLRLSNQVFDLTT